MALNLASLKAEVTTFSVIGSDDDGVTLTDLLEKNDIKTDYLIRSENRITTNKARIISMNQQMMRLDSETTRDLSPGDEQKIIGAVRKYLEQEHPKIIIFEDYNKGVLTENVIREVISLCREHGVLTSADPKRKNFFSYRGVDIFKPNLKEVRDGLNLLLEQINPPTLDHIHGQLADKLHHHISLITLSEKGVYYHADHSSRVIPSHLRNIADVSGAGDTVIAVASLVFAATGDADLMAEMANVAGGLVCEEVGTVAIDRNRLLGECKLLLEP